MRGYILSEIQKAWIWYRRVASIFAQWIFQMFVRVAIACATLYLLGGGCFLRSYWNNKEESEKRASTSAQQGPEAMYGSEQSAPAPVYRERKGNLQTQIRTGQSQLKAWAYTLRSIKRDIDYRLKR